MKENTNCWKKLKIKTECAFFITPVRKGARKNKMGKRQEVTGQILDFIAQPVCNKDLVRTPDTE